MPPPKPFSNAHSGDLWTRRQSVMMTAASSRSPSSMSNHRRLPERESMRPGSLILEITPRMIAAFLLAGLVQAIVPQEVIVRWMGHGTGFKGILIGMSLGGITPGGPMTHFPVIATFYKMGVGIGPLGCLLDRVVALRLAADYNVGNSISWCKSRRNPFCREFSLPAFRRLALRVGLGQTPGLKSNSI